MTKLSNAVSNEKLQRRCLMMRLKGKGFSSNGKVNTLASLTTFNDGCKSNPKTVKKTQKLQISIAVIHSRALTSDNNRTAGAVLDSTNGDSDVTFAS
jgi:hypothetical protein